MPDSDNVISVTSEQVLTISRPSQRNSMWFSSFGVTSEFWFQFFDNSVVVQVQDLNTRSSGSNQPVSVWREGESKDFVFDVNVDNWGFFSQRPNHDVTVFTTSGDQGDIWRDGNSVDVVVVTDQVRVNLEFLQVPELLKT